MPTGLIEQQHRVTAGRHFGGYGGELEVHRLGVAPWQHQPDGFPLRRTDGTENIDRCGAEVPGSRGPRAAFGPAARDFVLLPDAGLVAEPDFYLGGIDASLTRDVCQRVGELFLNVSIAPAA